MKDRGSVASASSINTPAGVPQEEAYAGSAVPKRFQNGSDRAAPTSSGANRRALGKVQKLRQFRSPA